MILLALGLIAAGWSSARAQAPDSQYFPQTGHSLQGDFLKFYLSISDPTTIYGYPITEQIKARDGLLVQYFQRARFEYHPELPAGHQILLTDLGRRMFVQGDQFNSYNPFACRFFQETNYSVCYAFLDFFDKNGGAAQFGYPISPFQYDNGVIVQYFQNARFEWQPARPEGLRVVLTDLGRLYFDKAGEDPGLLQAAAPFNGAPSSVIAIQVHAFVWKALTLSTDQQKLFIIVQDQRGAPVSASTCTANVAWPGAAATYDNFTTDANGVSITKLDVVNQPVENLVLIHVSCSYNGLAAETRTSFRIWH